MFQVQDQRRIPFMSLEGPRRLSRFNPPAFRLSGRGVF